MTKIPLLVLLLLPLLLSAQSPVWKVSKNQQTLYIGGTCHILRSSDYPLPASFDTAYADAEVVVFEINPAELNDPKVAMQLMAKASYTDGQTLETELSAEAYEALSKQAAKTGLPMTFIDRFKVGMAVNVLAITELAKLGVTEQGVDLHYSQRAQKDSKRVESLETVDFQIALFATMGEGYESEFVLYSLKDFSKIETFFNDMIVGWRTGDLQAIEDLFLEEMKAYPKLYQDLLVKRNLAWIPQIEAYMKTPEREVILVGAAHLAGKDGVLEMLKAKGYTIEQM